MAGEYSIENDPDNNKYENSDIQDLTESGMGEGLRKVVSWAGLLMFFIIIPAMMLMFKKITEDLKRDN